MRLEEAKEILNWSQQQMRLGNLPDYSQNVYQAEVAVLQELEHLQKENEEYSKQLDLDYVDKNFVSREKIENKIKEYFEYDKKHKTYTSDGRENYTYEYYKALTLQDLLREE